MAKQATLKNLADFLLARIAEDEANLPEGFDCWYRPERYEAECEAKRRMLTFVLEHGASIDGEFGCCHDADALLAGGREFDPVPDDCPGVQAAAPGLAILALPYAEHPDYRQEWRA